MACKNSLETDNVVIWNTRLPYQGEPRTSPAFQWMGSEWCFRFLYGDDIGLYHNMRLHRMSEGEIEEVERLEEPFRVKAYMMPLEGNEGEEIEVKNTTVDTTRRFIWFCRENKKLEIYEKLEWLYDCPEVKFACRFLGPPSTSFKVRIGTSDCLPPAKSTPQTEEKSVQVSSEVPRDIESLSSDLSHLLDKEILPDVRLECGGRTFRAHRSVLAARSRVFRAMFQDGTLESETGTVKVQDVDVDVLETLLKFAYAGKPEDICEGNAADIYEAADQYEVLSLTSACAYWIERNLTVENCVQYLKVSDSHSDTDLKAAVVSFITGNPSVMKSESWFELSEELPLLAKEVLQTYVSSIVL